METASTNPNETTGRHLAPASRLRGWISLGFVIGIAALPYLYLFPGLNHGEEIRLAALSLILLCAGVLMLIAPAPSLKLHPALPVLAGACALWIAVTSLHAQNPSEGLIVLLRLLILFTASYAAAWIFKTSPGRLKTFILAIAVASIPINVIAAVEIFSPRWLQWLPGGVPPHSLLSNRSQLATYNLLTIPLSIAGIWFHSKRPVGILFPIALGLCLHSVAAAQSRAAWLALSVAVFLSVIAYTLHLRRHTVRFSMDGRKAASLLLAALFCFAIGLFFSGPKVNSEPALSRMSSIASLEHPSNHARLQLWQKSLALIRQKPLLGVGAGNWKVEILSEGADDLVIPIWRAYPTYTHNELLQLWAESGTVGLILFLSLVAALGLHLVKSLAKSTVPDVCIPLAISLWGLGCFLIVGQFDFPFQQAVPLSLLGVLVGMGIAQTAELRDGRSRAISYLPIMLCALFSCFVFIQRTAFEARLSRWDRALRKGSFAESQPRELRWYTLDPSATPPGNYTATALLHQGRSNDALTVLRKALRHNPNNLLVQNNIAAAFLKLGMLDSANQYVDRIQSICSAYPDALINKSILFLHRSELDSASFTLSRVAAERRNGQWLQLARLVNSRLETGYNGQEAGIH